MTEHYKQKDFLKNICFVFYDLNLFTVFVFIMVVVGSIMFIYANNNP